MIIFITAVVVILIGILFLNYFEWEFFGGLLIMIGGMVLCIVLIAGYLVPLETRGEIVRFEATRQTIKIARETGNELEKAAVQHKIIECNNWLASKVYWNQTIFDIFIPDEVMQLKPLK